MRTLLEHRAFVAVLAVLAACCLGRGAEARTADDPHVRGLHEDFKGQAIAAAPAPEAKAAAAAAVVAEEAAASTTPGCPEEPFRPLVHFSPRALWMNDPNGLVYAAGEWHLFYQFNPESATPANISWGHAVSPDLVHWTELTSKGRAAIVYDGDRELIFSGSAVLDQDNTSGLGTTENPAMVAIYTSHYHTQGKEAQSLAYSLDNGRTWTKYAGNPVLDEGMKEFRDPKVQWHAPTRRWLMVVALPDDRKARFYSSPDLKVWTRLSDFGPMGSVTGQYECPDLFPLPVDDDLGKLKWVLVVNVNPGGLQGGSSAQYFIGDFDGEKFVPDDTNTSTVRWLDYGKDYYAAVSWVGAPDGQRYMIGWMSNWQYSASTPTSPWRNAMSVPRVMSLRSRADGGVDLLQEPVPALASTLQRAPSPLSNLTAGLDAVVVARGCDGAFFLDATLTLRDGATGASVLVRAAEDGSSGTAIVVDAKNAELSIDRRRSGLTDFSNDFPGVHAAPVNPDVAGHIHIKVLVDEGSVELFADGGRVVITDTIFPDEANKAILVKAEGAPGATVDFGDVRITPLRAYRSECASREVTCALATPGAPATPAAPAAPTA